MPKRWADLTPEQKERKLALHRARSKRKRAERAIAEGRIPGVSGGPRKLTDEERVEHLKANAKRFREKDVAATRAYDAEWKRRKRREKAAVEGREVGKPGYRVTARKKTPDQLREYCRLKTQQYRDKNPKKYAGLARDRYLANRDEVNRKSRERIKWLKENDPEKYRAQTATRDRNRRAKHKGSSGKHKSADIEFLWTAQKGHCVFCLKPLIRGKFHVDHHVPLALGGSNDRSNLRLLHKKCNLEKSWRDPIEHAREHGMLFW